MDSRDVKYCSNCRTIGTAVRCETCNQRLLLVCVRNCPSLVSVDELARLAQTVVDGFVRDVARQREV